MQACKKWSKTCLVHVQLLTGHDEETTVFTIHTKKILTREPELATAVTFV